LDLTFKAPPISYHLAKFHGDRSSELGDFGPKCKKKQLPPNCLSGRPKFWDLRCPSAHISNHVSKFHSNRRGQLGDIERQSRIKTSAVKHKTVGNYRFGGPNNLNKFAQLY